MKVLYLTPNIMMGSRGWLYRELDTLNKYFDLTVLTTNFDGKNYQRGMLNIFSLDPLKNRIWVRIIRKLFLGKLIDRYPDFKLRYILRKGKYDIVIINFANFAIKYYDILKKCRVPVLVKCHGADITTDLCNHRGYKVYASDYPDKLANLSKITYFVANSKFMSSLMVENYIISEKILLKYFAVPIPNVELDKKKRELQVLYIGRLIDAKGPDLVIKAFEIAVEKGFTGRLVVAGDGDLLVTCKIMAERSYCNDKIDIVGEITSGEAEDLYRASDIFTHHSCKGLITGQKESFGVVFIEAMSYGLPVITGNCGGPSEIIIDGKNGFLVESGNIEKHAEAFCMLDRDRSMLRRMSENARMHVINNFSESDEEAKWKDLFAHAISGKNS